MGCFYLFVLFVLITNLVTGHAIESEFDDIFEPNNQVNIKLTRKTKDTAENKINPVIYITEEPKSVTITTKGQPEPPIVTPYTVNKEIILTPGEVALPKYGVYLLGFTILFLIIAVLLLTYYIVYLRRNKYSQSIVSNNLKNDDTYKRQVSQETNILLTPLPNHSESRFDVNNQNITTVDYSISSEYNGRTAPDVPKKQQPPPFIATGNPIIPLDQMRLICSGVINKVKNKESTSLSNLDKIINEEQDRTIQNEMDIQKNNKLEKCLSSPILDKIDDSIDGAQIEEKESSYSSLERKTFKKPEKENGSLYKIESKEGKLDEICDNPPISRRSQGNNDQKTPPNIERFSVNSSSCLIDDSKEDEVYDNPPTLARPVSSTIDFIQEEIYETGPSNRPLTLLKINDDLDNVYDNPKPKKDNKFVAELKIKLNSTTKLDKGQDGDYEKDNVYDSPRKNQEMMFTKADDTDYLMVITSDSEGCIEPSYTNAKQLKTVDKE